MANTIQKIKEKLEEFGIEIHKEFKTENLKEDVIIADNLTITCNRHDIFVAFSVAAKPSYAARIMLILSEVKGLKDFCVGEDYYIDKTGKFLDGEEASTFYKKSQEEKTINNYMNQQAQIFYLTKAKHYHC